MALDAAKYNVEVTWMDEYKLATKSGLAVRKWMEEKGLGSVTVNFLTLDICGLPKMPFPECCKVMERGQGYAGEGDVLRLRASIAADEKQLLPALKGLPCMRRVKLLPPATPGLCEVEMECDRRGGGREEPHLQLHRLLSAMDAPLHMLMPRRDTLEEVFLRVTAESPNP